MDETCPLCTGGGGRPPRPPRAAAPRSGWRPLGRGPQRQAAGLRWSAPRPPPPDCRAQRAWCFCRPSPRGASPRRWLGLPDRVADEHAADEAPGRQHQGRRAGGGGRLRGLNKTGRCCEAWEDEGGDARGGRAQSVRHRCSRCGCFGRRAPRFATRQAVRLLRRFPRAPPSAAKARARAPPRPLALECGAAAPRVSGSWRPASPAVQPAAPLAAAAPLGARRARAPGARRTSHARPTVAA